MAQYDNRDVPKIGGYAQTGDAALDAGLRAYMLRVYNYMGLGVAGTAIFTLLLMNNPDMMRAIAMGPMKWVLFAGILGLGFFAQKLFFSGSVLVAHGDHGFQLRLGGGDRCDDIDDIALAGRDLHRLLLGHARGLPRFADGFLHRAAELAAIGAFGSWGLIGARGLLIRACD